MLPCLAPHKEVTRALPSHEDALALGLERPPAGARLALGGVGRHPLGAHAHGAGVLRPQLQQLGAALRPAATAAGEAEGRRSGSVERR